jgi:hypothetical protein
MYFGLICPIESDVNSSEEAKNRQIPGYLEITSSKTVRFQGLEPTTTYLNSSFIAYLPFCRWLPSLCYCLAM